MQANYSTYPSSDRHDLVEGCPWLITAVLVKMATAAGHGGGLEHRDLAMVFKRFISA